MKCRSSFLNFSLSQKRAMFRMALLMGLGQCLAVCLSLTGLLSTYLVDNTDFKAPMLQCFCCYVTIFIVFSPLWWWRCRSAQQQQQHAVWKYALLAICDVEANFLFVKAYQYTDLPSVQLLDCFTIPSAMLLSRIILKTKVVRQQIIGTVCCVAGLVWLVYTDVSRDHQSQVGILSKLMGDIFCLTGAFFYAITNVGCEYLLKTPQIAPPIAATAADDGEATGDNDAAPIQSPDQLPAQSSSSSSLSTASSAALKTALEYLTFLSLFGAIVSFVQCTALEHDVIASNWRHWVFEAPHFFEYLSGFCLVMLIIYSVVPLFLFLSSATFFNLSMLCSDGYALLLSVLLLDYTITWAFFLSFGVIISGLVIYHTANTAATSAEEMEEEEEEAITTSEC